MPTSTATTTPRRTPSRPSPSCRRWACGGSSEMKRLVGLLVAAAVVSCGSFRDPGDLHYARTLAVRAEPPRVSPGQRARIDLLVTNNDGVPVERAPDQVTLPQARPGRPAAPPEAAQLITQDNGAWYV